MKKLKIEELKDTFIEKAKQYSLNGNNLGLRIFVVGKNKEYESSDNSLTENLLAHFNVPMEGVNLDKRELLTVIIPSIISNIHEKCDIQGIGLVGTANMMVIKKNDKTSSVLDMVDSFEKKEVFISVYSTEKFEEKKVFVKKKIEETTINEKGELVSGFEYVPDSSSDTGNWQGDFADLYNKFVKSHF